MVCYQPMLVLTSRGDNGVSRWTVEAATQRECDIQMTDRNVKSIFGRLAEQNKDLGESLTVRSFQAGELIAEAKDMARSLFLVVVSSFTVQRGTGVVS